MAVKALSLPFAEQNQFLRRKLNVTTEGWTDIYAREHDQAFMVAGANRDELLSDFRRAVERAVVDGVTLEQFRQDFDRIVAKHGWSYNGGRNWRSRVIYETNLRSSYMAGRYEQLMAVREQRPFWQYIHNDAVEHPRPEHQAWNGMVLRFDDPWWQYHFPVNAWGCQCSVRALSMDDLLAMGKTGPDTAPEIVFETRLIGQRSAAGPREVQVPVGIDPGFEYIPGQSRLASQVPTAGDLPPPSGTPSSAPMPSPRIVEQGQLLPQGMSDADYARAALNAFGAKLDAAELATDVLGERVAIGPRMFQTATGAPQPLAEQGPLLPLLGETFLQPDEIWSQLEYLPQVGKAQVRRSYLSRFLLGQTLQAVSLSFANGQWSWSINSDASAADLLRAGVLLYRREGDE